MDVEVGVRKKHDDATAFDIETSRWHDIRTFLDRLWYFYLIVMIVGGTIVFWVTFVDIGPPDGTMDVQKSYIFHIIFPIYIIVFAFYVIFRAYHILMIICILVSTAVVSYMLGAVSMILFNDVAKAALIKH